jgi:uracil-DNA glycosylase
MMNDDIVAATDEALRQVAEPRFLRTERGFQGQFYCALQRVLEARGVLQGGLILEMEYQKSARHGMSQRPDIVLHVPAEDSGAGVAGNNFAVWALKRRTTPSRAGDDFARLDEMFEMLCYPLGIFVNIDARDHLAWCYDGKFPERLRTVAVWLEDQVVTSWRCPDETRRRRAVPGLPVDEDGVRPLIVRAVRRPGRMADNSTTVVVRGREVRTLKDILPKKPGLRALFVAKTPAPESVAAGHYFQGRQGKMFWNRLRDYRLLQPTTSYEDDSLLDHGFGITDIVKLPRHFGDEPTDEEYTAGIDRILGLIHLHNPKVLVFVYKRVLDRILALRFGVRTKSKYGFNQELDRNFGSRIFGRIGVRLE